MENYHYKVDFFISNPFEDYGFYRLIRLEDEAILCSYINLDAMKKEIKKRGIGDTTYFE